MPQAHRCAHRCAALPHREWLMIAMPVRRPMQCILRPVFPFLVIAAASLHAQQRPRALDLQDVLDSVALRHPAVQAGIARVRAARGSRMSAGQLSNPILSYQVDNTPFPGGRPLDGIDREAMTMATFPLEPLYQRGSRTRQADARVRAADADARSIAQSLSLDAASAFHRTALAQVRVESLRDLANWLDTIVTYNRSRVREGVASEADLIRTLLERDRTLAEVSMQEAEWVRARAELSGFLGDPAFTGSALLLGFSSSVIDLPPETHSPQVASRPDLQAAVERVAASRAGVAVERTMVIRQLGATLGTKQQLGQTSMIAGLSLPIPLFDRNRGEVVRATAERDAAELEFEATNRIAVSQLAAARIAATLLTTRAASFGGSSDSGFLARASEAKSIALGAYREGAVPLFQVIDAARAWNEARIAYYDLLFAQHQSVIDLLFASGQDIRFGLAHITSGH